MELERRACPVRSPVCVGCGCGCGVWVWVWGGGGNSGSDNGPQAGVPVDSGIHFLSRSWDRRPGPDWPGQVNHTPLSPLPALRVEQHLGCPERRREDHSLKGPAPPHPPPHPFPTSPTRNPPSGDLHFERGLWCVGTPFSIDAVHAFLDL